MTSRAPMDANTVVCSHETSATRGCSPPHGKYGASEAEILMQLKQGNSRKCPAASDTTRLSCSMPLDILWTSLIVEESQVQCQSSNLASVSR